MFSTNRLPITVLTDASDALSRGALPSTVIVSVALPMDNVKSRRGALIHFEDDSVLMDGFESGGFHREIVGAGRERGMLYNPSWLEVTRACNAVFRALEGDLAFGTARPEGSEMIPESSAVCAIRLIGTRAKQEQPSNGDRPHSSSDSLVRLSWHLSAANTTASPDLMPIYNQYNLSRVATGSGIMRK